MNEVWWLVTALGVGLLPAVAVLVLRARAAARWRRGLTAYALRFPRGMEPGAVTAFLAGTGGLVAPRWRRAWAASGVMVETSATRQGIRHHMLVPRTAAPVVLASLRAALPDVMVREDEDYAPVRPTRAVELGLSNARRSLNVADAAAVSRRVLASLLPLADGESLVVQWSARPVGPVAPVRQATRRRRPASFLERLVWQLGAPEPRGEDVAALAAKQAAPLFFTAGRVGAVAPTPGRARALRGRVVAAFHMVHAPGVGLYRRRLPGMVVRRAVFEHRLPVVTYPAVLNAVELAALVGFPLGEVALPGLRLGGTRQLAPSTDIPAYGRVLAHATYPGAERPVAISVTDSLRHLHAIGPTGSGKSTLLLNLITQDVIAGRGVVLVEPKGDLVMDVLDRVPAHRANDVVLLDVTDDEYPVGLNLLSGAHRAPELVAEQIVGVFHQLYRANWGPRTDDILRAALLTLAPVKGMTLAEVPLLLTDAGFRRRLVGCLDDPVGLGPFFAWYEALSDGERAQAIGPVMNKLRAFLMRRRLRNVLGQAEPKLDLADALRERRIVLVPLSKGLLGEDAAALVGSLVVARVWQAVMGRAAVPADRRPMTFMYIDEFQDYLNLATNVGDVLAQARGLGLGLTLAHQHLGQLPHDLQEAVLANARSRVIFQTAATDAARLARELMPYLGAADLQGLDPYEVVMSVSAGARVAPPVTGRTLPPPEVTGQAEVIRAVSRARYGTDRAEVEAAIRARHEGVRPAAGAVGRREVSS